MNNPKINTLVTLLATALFLFLGTASEDETNHKPPTPENRKTDCLRLKNHCISQFKQKLPDMVRILREVENKEAKDGQILLSTIEGYALMEDLQEDEKNLETYCPDEFQSYKNKTGALLLLEMATSNN